MAELDDWNLADVWETVADTVGEAPALFHGERLLSWNDFESRSARLASVFTEHGIGRDSKVALYLHNCPQYLEATFAAFKCRAVPVNVNYRYTEAELVHLLENSDAEAVVVGAEFAERLAAVADRLPALRLVLAVDPDSDGSTDPWDSAVPAPRIRASSTICGSSTPAEPPACPRV